jgi:hypothetical protein
MARSSKKTNTTIRRKTKKAPRTLTLTVVSNELPMNTQVKVLKFLKDMNRDIQTTNYNDLLRFADKNKEFLGMKLNGSSLKTILKKTNENDFRKFKEFMNKLKTVTRKSLNGGSSRTLALRSRSPSRNNSPKENNQIIGFIESVNTFLDNPKVRGFIIKMSVLIIFLAFVVMVSSGLLRSNKAIELPELGENAIVTLGTTTIIGLVIIGSVKITTSTFKETVLRKQEIQQQMQEKYLQTVNNSAVTYGARGFAAMPQGQMGMPMMQGPYNTRSMHMGMPPMIQGPYNTRSMHMGY